MGTTAIQMFKDRGSLASHKKFAIIISCPDDSEQRSDIQAIELELLQKVRTARIAPMAQYQPLDLDGISYELSIADEGSASAIPGIDQRSLPRFVLLETVRKMCESNSSFTWQ